MSETLHPIAKLLVDRRRSSSKPGHRSDGRKIALAIEGGGLRGVISGAMVGALEDLDLLNCFDSIYGSSAGSIAGAYFLSGQARSATTIFYDLLNNDEFLNPWRILVGKPALSLEFLLDNVCIRDRPLDTERVLRSPIPLNVICTSISRLQSVKLSDFADATELFQALRCSARIPFVAGPPVPFRGDQFLDASVYESIPYKAAIEDGYTDIVTLLTRPAGRLRGKPNLLDRFIVGSHLRRIHPDLASHYLARGEHYREEVQEVMRLSTGGSSVRTLPIQIEASETEISSYEKRRSVLLHGAMSGFQAVYRALGLPIPTLVEVLTPVDQLRLRTNPIFSTL